MSMNNRRSFRALLIIPIMVGLLYDTRPMFSCGPFMARAVFTYSMHPDFPLERFAAGELGVLQPTYARSYLYVAYRHITGVGFNQEEQKALVSVWKARLDSFREEDQESGGVKRWLAARSKIPGVAPLNEIRVYRSPDRKDYYLNYLNCPENAFQNAVSSLSRYVEKYGATSAEVKEWVAAQDQVFANCSEGQTIPAPLGAGAPAPLQADRTYQIASANFYAGNFDVAENMFGAIAASAASPHRSLAPYLVARTLVRKATLGAGEGEADKATLARAEAQLKKVLSDPSQAPVHAAAKRLMSFVSFRLDPERRLRELAQAVLKKDSGQSLGQDVWDYTALMNKFVNDDEERKFEALPESVRVDDLTDWVMTFQVMDKAALDYTLQKWAKTSSVPWLVAAISKIDPAHPRAPELIEAAARARPSSPAFATLAFHSLRLTIESGKKEGARKRLDTLLGAGGATLPPSATNLFLSLKMNVARNLDELLKYAQRPPVSITYDFDGRELPEDVENLKKDEQLRDFAAGRTSFDADSAKVLNERIPLAVLKEAATSKTLPIYLRREVALAAWVRAALLDNEELGKALVPTLEQLWPELKPFLGEYLSAETNDAKKFAAIFLMLKYPGTRPVVNAGVGRLTELEKIDDFRDNWWCAFRPNAEKTTSVKPQVSDSNSYPEFLSAAERAAAAAEWKNLGLLATAPNYFSMQAVKWAAIKPDDPRAPEALHLAVRSTRYGCTDGETGKFSKQAFDTLHKRYPNSAWANKTKYWYK